MKKIIKLGVCTTTIAPIIGVVSCGSTNSSKLDLSTITAYFNKVGKKIISIPSSTIIKDNATLLTAIKATIGSNLTTEQKNTLSLVTNYGTWNKGTAKDIAIKVGNTKNAAITLNVTHLKSNFEKQEMITAYFNTVAKKTISIPGMTVITDNEALLSAIKVEIGSGLTAEQKTALSVRTTYEKFTKKAEKEITIAIGVGSEIRDTIKLSVTHLRTNSEEIAAYFNTVAKKTISIPDATTITNNPTLLTAIKAAIGSNLTAEKKVAITIKTAYADLIKGTEKIIKIGIKVGSETEITIDLKVTQKSDAIYQQKITSYFTDNGGSKKTISIPDATTITNNPTLLTAIKTAIGSDLTAQQKTAITIKTDYATLTKGTEKIIEIGIKVGSETEITINLKVTQKSDAIYQQKIVTYFTANANAKKTISIPSATTITNNSTLLAAIKTAIGSGLTAKQKTAITTIKTAYANLIKGTSKTIQIGIKFGSATEITIDLKVTHLST